MAETPQKPGAQDAALQQLLTAISGLRANIQALEQYLTGVVKPAAVVPSAVKPPSVPTQPVESLRILTSPSQEAAPTVSPSASLQELLYQLLTQGLKQRAYDVVDAVIAPEPITSTGSQYDAGEYYDAWVIIPSVDTRISFTHQPDQNTPFVGAGQSVNFQVKARYIFYQAALPTLRGTLSLWLAKYK